MRSVMIERAETTNEKLISIFDDVGSRFPDVSEDYVFSSVSSTLCRKRSSSRPKIPNNMSELNTALNNTICLKAAVKSSNQKTAIIFSTDDLLFGVSESDQWFVDGTFSYIAGLIILMENRDTAMYDAVFSWLITKFPNLKTKPIEIITDFEKATLKSLRNNFTGAKMYGCYFHFVHALIRRWIQSSLKTPDYILSLMMNVPLLPPELFPEAGKVINDEINKIKHLDQNILIYFDYFKDTWLSKPNQSIIDPNFRSTGIKEILRVDVTKLTPEAPLVQFRNTFLEWCNEKVNEINEQWFEVAERSRQLITECHGLMSFLAEVILEERNLAEDMGLLLCNHILNVLQSPALNTITFVCISLKVSTLL
ncbi:uncharacterized protein LOC130670422 [Microplitis mediator]|uniref:uncharacterized protein LOC130670422 n=1 Tax=Microplitis mediator TaxID=375433 RepID=UPI00255748F3|nr:uncharacterized protein LOC130670422 [Microplitis mediator]